MLGRPRKNFDAAVRMYGSGKSVEAVAVFFKMSRQAMWKILKRRGVEFRSQRRSGKANPFYRHGRGTTPSQRAAIAKVGKAIRRGKLVPKPCEVCGANGKARDGRRAVHAHHDDYSKPLDVRWLCKKHHDEFHAGAT